MEFSFADAHTIYFQKLCIAIAGLVMLALTYLDPLGFLPTETSMATLMHTFVLLAGVGATFYLLKIFRSDVVVAAKIHDHNLTFITTRLFADSRKERLLEGKNLYYFKPSGNPKSRQLVTRFGVWQLYSSSGVKEFCVAINERFFNNRSFYELLKEPDIFDIYQALPPGKQARLVIDVINKNTADDRQEKINQLLTPESTPRPNLDECPNCLSRNLEKTTLYGRNVYMLEFKSSRYSIPTQEQFFGETYPAIHNSITACLDCGLAWTSIDIEKFTLQEQKYRPSE